MIHYDRFLISAAIWNLGKSLQRRVWRKLECAALYGFKKNPITKPHFLSVSLSLSNSHSKSQDAVWRVCQSFVVAFFSSQCPLGFFFPKPPVSCSILQVFFFWWQAPSHHAPVLAMLLKPAPKLYFWICTEVFFIFLSFSLLCFLSSPSLLPLIHSINTSLS